MCCVISVFSLKVVIIFKRLLQSWGGTDQATFDGKWLLSLTFCFCFSSICIVCDIFRRSTNKLRIALRWNAKAWGELCRDRERSLAKPPDAMMTMTTKMIAREMNVKLLEILLSR